MTEPSTPLMRQYAAVKKDHPTALLFFRLGDFYELFFDDAVVAAKELQITLTSRNKEKGLAVPMCGVPHHAAEGYIGKLIRKGFKVAICEQMEDARLAKKQMGTKLVRREVTRVVTPGTASDSLLGSEENNFLAALAQSGDRVGCAAYRKNSISFVPKNCSTVPLRRCSKATPAALIRLNLAHRAQPAPKPHSTTGSSLPTTQFPYWKTISEFYL
jgi:DNA mismatch repair ATPase MutS